MVKGKRNQAVSPSHCDTSRTLAVASGLRWEVLSCQRREATWGDRKQKLGVQERAEHKVFAPSAITHQFKPTNLNPKAGASHLFATVGIPSIPSQLPSEGSRIWGQVTFYGPQQLSQRGSHTMVDMDLKVTSRWRCPSCNTQGFSLNPPDSWKKERKADHLHCL